MTVLRPQVKIVFLALLLTTSAIGRAADPPGAAVSGVVRDAQGIVQMGALVQVVADDSALVGTAFTDLHGRYLILHLLPGKYEVRASAALFVPALRGNLELRPGVQAVVNLTLNTLFETAAWLPAERRKADEPNDDWKWTLRSAANRPILRFDEDGDVMTISSSATESSKASTRASAGVIAGDGGLGNNGVHDVFSLDRVLDDGAGVTMRADIGTFPTSGPSTDVATGYERRLGFAGAARTVVSYQSHPELLGSDGTTGLQAIQLASAQKMQIGDFADLQAGGILYVVRTSGLASASQPFLKVTVHPGETWTLGYRMATSQNLQSYEGLDSVRQPLPVAVEYQGRMQTEHGLHQEFTVGRKLGSGVVRVAYYRDSLDRVMVSGGGALTTTDLGQEGLSNTNGVIADTSTGDFRFLTGGYKAQGLNVTLSEPLTSSLWVAFEYSTGAALKIQNATVVALSDAPNDLTTERDQSATVALKGSVVRSGTRIRAAYHWQPTRLVTAINPYAAFSDQAYLSCYLRQAIRLGHLVPPGLDATVDITNLLAQGYHPFLSADGQTLFLAQSPRTMQAGLAFTF
jgi:Carboxypeptidase regulatory-like domain